MFLTRAILNKHESDLTEDERILVNNHKYNIEYRKKEFDEKTEELKNYCPILCSGQEKDIIPTYGWIRPIEKMAYNLEFLNNTFGKYGYKIVFDQTKEKFGTFRGYWNIISEPIGFFGPFVRFFGWIFNKMDNVDYRKEWVVDKPEYTTIEWEDCTEDEFTNMSGRYGHKPEKVKMICETDECTDNGTTYFKKTSDGKFMRSYVLHHPRITHMEIRKHRILWKLRFPILKMQSFFGSIHQYTNHEKMMMKYLENNVSEIVDKCEKECYDRCEVCGDYIGDHGMRDRCETHGWVSYICDRCAHIRGGMWYNTKDKKWYKDSVECENPYKKRSENTIDEQNDK